MAHAATLAHWSDMFAQGRFMQPHADLKSRPKKISINKKIVYLSSIQALHSAMVFEQQPRELDLFTTFNVHERSGFLPPTPPPTRLSSTYEPWEVTLDLAIQQRLHLGDDPSITEEQKATNEEWRAAVRDMPVLSAEELESDEEKRRAHLVLAYLTHFYIHSLPLSEPVRIPPPLTIPLLKVSEILDIPPLLIYADTGIYNWYPEGGEASLPTTETIRTQTSFTNSIHEEEFYLCATRIELRGVEALSLMRSISHLLASAYMVSSSTQSSSLEPSGPSEADVLNDKISSHLARLSIVVQDLRTLLLRVREKCDPEVYYTCVRPWFRGEDSTPGREWVFEGGVYPSGRTPNGGGERLRELSGPSAGQSALIHLLDIFLGVDHSYGAGGIQQKAHAMGKQSGMAKRPKSFMERMQTYMPTPHRLFLEYVKRDPYPLRPFVLSLTPGSSSPPSVTALTDAYNTCVRCLKEFRDAHMIIATLYIIGPARRDQKRRAAANAVATDGEKQEGKQSELKGTGGTDLVKFLKDTRTRTEEAIVKEEI